MDYINNTDPLILAIIAGALGGLIRGSYKKYIASQQYPLNSTEFVPHIGFWNICFQIFLGACVAFMITMMSISTQDNAGTVIVSILSGITAPLFIDKLMDERKANENSIELATQLASENDLLEAMAKFISNKDGEEDE